MKIGISELRTVVETEIKFCCIAMQMMRANMLVSPIHPTLKHAEKALCGVGMSISPHIFALAMANHIVLIKFRTDMEILPCVIGHKMGIWANIVSEIRSQGFGGDIRDMKRAHFAVALRSTNESTASL